MTVTNKNEIIDDTESLFRSVKNISENFKLIDGRLVICHSAFNDRNKKPSVNRARLMPDPNDTKKSKSDGVVSLVTEAVRAIGDIPVNSEGGLKNLCYTVDVIARPNPEAEPTNSAHAQIEASPHPEASTRFKKIKERLARLATESGWTLEPESEQPSSTAQDAFVHMPSQIEIIDQRSERSSRGIFRKILDFILGFF